MRQFWVLHVVAVFVHAGCAIYAFTNPLLLSTPIPVLLRSVSYDDPQGDYFDVTRTRHFHIPSVIALHGIVAVVTTLFHVFVYFPVHAWECHTVWTQGFFAMRWVEYAITCTLMSVAATMSAGTLDFNILVSLVFYGFALQLVGAAIEQIKRHFRILLVIGVLVNLGSSYSTIYYVLSSAATAGYQWIEFGFYTFYYALFPLNCVLDARVRGPGRFIETDWIYNVLSLTSKVALFWIQVGEVERQHTTGNWPLVEIYALGMVLPLSMLLLGVQLTPRKRPPIHSHESAPSCIRSVARLRLTPETLP